MKKRKPNRLKDYDYSSAGYYFVTICTHNRICLFGEIKNGKMYLNKSGEMIQKIWQEIPLYYRGIQIDEFIIMPNHIHGIIIIVPAVGADPRVGPDIAQGRPQGAAPTKRLSLSDVMHRYKSLTTKRYIDGVAKYNWLPFDAQLWQRSFYDHVIRDEITLGKIRKYIANNPAQWETDEENREGNSRPCG